MNTHSSGQQQRPDPSDEPVKPAAKLIDRRTLLRAGAAASPVLLTLRSGPVSAGTSGCITASAFGSAAALKSRNGGHVTVDCGRRNCEWWHAEARSHRGHHLLHRKVGACLGHDGRNAYDKWTCKDVMSAGIATSGELAVIQHLIALISNCESGYHNTQHPIFNVAYLRAVRQNYYDSGRLGYRMSRSGDGWNEAQLIAWLRSMLGYPIV